MKNIRFSLLCITIFLYMSCQKQQVNQNPLSSPSPQADQKNIEKESNEGPEQPLQMGQQFWSWFATEDFQQLFSSSSPDVQKALSIDTWNIVSKQIKEQFGTEGELIEEKLTPYQGMTIYRRTSRWTNGNLLTNIVFTKEGVLTGFQIVPAPVVAESQFLDYQTKTLLTVPFIGEWYIFWGGRTIEKNYHAMSKKQRFALDIVVYNEGKSFKSTGKTNEDYFAFGKDVRAPGAGIVVSVENNIPDNIPGEMNPKQPMGNHVIIDHGNSEYSFLAHFKQGSLSVQKGDTVTLGQIIGLCGNSGNSSEAHIHYHLQNTAVFGSGEGLPAQFTNYLQDGELVQRGELEQGQSISSQ